MDTVAQALIGIKNGYMASKKEVVVPYSKMILAILKLLKEEGYVAKVKVQGRKLRVTLKYEGRDPVLTSLERVSKPSKRVYLGYRNLPRVLDGLGIAIVSTPKGVVTDREARKMKIGGEIVAYIW